MGSVHCQDSVVVGLIVLEEEGLFGGLGVGLIVGLEVALLDPALLHLARIGQSQIPDCLLKCNPGAHWNS